MLASFCPVVASGLPRLCDAFGPSNIAGYRIYHGRTSLSYPNTVAVGNTTTATLSNLVSGTTYYFAATGCNRSNVQRDFSNEVKADGAQGLPITAHTCPVHGGCDPASSNPKLNFQGARRVVPIPLGRCARAIGSLAACVKE